MGPLKAVWQFRQGYFILCNNALQCILSFFCHICLYEEKMIK